MLNYIVIILAILNVFLSCFILMCIKKQEKEMIKIKELATLKFSYFAQKDARIGMPPTTNNCEIVIPGIRNPCQAGLDEIEKVWGPND